MQYTASSPLTSVAVHCHLVVLSSLSTLLPCVVHRPLSSLVVASPPPSRRVVPCPRLSLLRCRSEGTAALPHPSPSRRRRGKIPPIVVVLRSGNDTSSRPPPSSSLVVHCPPPPHEDIPAAVVTAPSSIPRPLSSRHPTSALVATSATTSPPPSSSPPPVAALRTFILAKNAAAALLLASARDVVSDGGRGGRHALPTPASCHTPPPQQHVDCRFPFKADAAALLSRQHHVRRPTPTTFLTPQQYRWRRHPRRDGSVARVALVSSLSASRPRCTGVRRSGVIVGQVGSRTEEVDC